ncbi:hypothetical protein AaE_008077, partial [Aphanomyces astaci]
MLPNTTYDFHVMQNSSLLTLMSKFSNRNLLRRRPLCATDGTQTWLLTSGTIGSLHGGDTVIHVDGLTQRHAQITCRGDSCFVQSSPNCATYLKLPFDTGRRGYPISVGDIIEMGRGFVVRVVEIDVKTTSSVDKVEKLPPLKETTFAKLVLQLHHKEPADVIRVVTSPKNTLWFGSLHSSDIICPTLERLHAKIEFDGSRYVLSDFSNATRVVVGEIPVHIVPEDVLVVGDRHFKIVELKDDAVATPGLEIQTLRISARKRSHTKKHMPIKLDLPPNKLLHVGRAPQCNITLSNYSIKLVQFSILYENDRVWVMPLNGSLNQGLYRLLSRQERQREETVHDTTVPVVSSVSPLLQLHKDTVFKVGCSEVEVVYIKHQPKSVSATTQDQMNDRYSILQELPWFLLSQNLPG